jgi:hypothetical protein
MTDATHDRIVGHAAALIAEKDAEIGRLRAALEEARGALAALNALIDFEQPLDQEAMIFADQTAINRAMAQAMTALRLLREEVTPR